MWPCGLSVNSLAMGCYHIQPSNWILTAELEVVIPHPPKNPLQNLCSGSHNDCSKNMLGRGFCLRDNPQVPVHCLGGSCPFLWHPAGRVQLGQLSPFLLPGTPGPPWGPVPSASILDSDSFLTLPHIKELINLSINPVLIQSRLGGERAVNPAG